MPLAGSVRGRRRCRRWLPIPQVPLASHCASSCAVLLRLVTPRPLFTQADASLTPPMGSRTDTSRTSSRARLPRTKRANMRADQGRRVAPALAGVIAPGTARRSHAPLGYDVSKWGTSDSRTLPTNAGSLRHDLKADGWVSEPPRVVTGNRCVEQLTSPGTARSGHLRSKS
jgi:hypothetical protein